MSECIGGLLLSYLQQNKTASEKQCQSLVHHLKRSHLTPIIENLSPEIEMKDIANAITKIDTEYYQNAKGPAKNTVYDDFMKV